MARYVKLSLVNGGNYYRPFSELEKILDAIDKGEIEGFWVVDFIHMTQREYTASPKAFWKLRKEII